MFFRVARGSNPLFGPIVLCLRFWAYAFDVYGLNVYHLSYIRLLRIVKGVYYPLIIGVFSIYTICV